MFQRSEKFQHFVLIVSVVQLAVLFLSPFALRGHFLELPIIIFDTVLSIIFLVDILMHRKRSLGEWIIDVWSVAPFLLLFGSTPLALMLNVGKLLRGLRGIAGLHFRRHGVDVTSSIKVVATFLAFVIYFATLIVILEGSTNENLSTVGGGLWWAIVTITTTGYGDVTPGTPLGRVAAALLMLLGIGISSAIGAVFVSILLRPTENKILKEERAVKNTERSLTKEEGEVLRILRRLDNRVGKLETAVSKCNC